jgi:hypothetical protein
MPGPLFQSGWQRAGKARRQLRRSARLGTNQKFCKIRQILLAIRLRNIYQDDLFWGEQNDWAPRAIGSGAQFAFPACLPARRREIWLADCLD